MRQVTIELSALEVRGARAAVLEALTDQVFDAEPDLLAQSEYLLAELSTGGTPAEGAARPSRTVQIDSVGLEVVDRSFAHAAASIEGWELSIRIGLTVDQLHELRSRISALRRGAL
jgi:hypothetical protein